mgnify:CR=1 FL=1
MLYDEHVHVRVQTAPHDASWEWFRPRGCMAHPWGREPAEWCWVDRISDPLTIVFYFQDGWEYFEHGGELYTRWTPFVRDMHQHTHPVPCTIVVWSRHETLENWYEWSHTQPDVVHMHELPDARYHIY